MDDEGKERFLRVVRDAFSNRLREQIRWLAEECRSWCLEAGLHDLGEIISSARSLGATEAEPPTKEELDELTVGLSKFQAKKDFDGMRRFLREFVLKKGIPMEVLGSE